MRLVKHLHTLGAHSALALTLQRRVCGGPFELGNKLQLLQLPLFLLVFNPHKVFSGDLQLQMVASVVKLSKLAHSDVGAKGLKL